MFPEDPLEVVPEGPRSANLGMAGIFVLGLLFVVAVFGAVWRIDDHFVTRREFQQLQADVTAIREHLGIPRGAEHDPGGGK